jgi:hypothetical protein
MIAWLLAFLALVGVGWARLDHAAGTGRWGWLAPPSGLWDDAVEQPVPAATVLQADGVAARLLEHGAALQRLALGPLTEGRPFWSQLSPGTAVADVRPTVAPSASATLEEAHMRGPRHTTPSRRPCERSQARFKESSTSRQLRPGLGLEVAKSRGARLGQRRPHRRGHSQQAPAGPRRPARQV